MTFWLQVHSEIRQLQEAAMQQLSSTRYVFCKQFVGTFENVIRYTHYLHICHAILGGVA